MRRAEGARGNESVPARQEPGDREDFGDFDALFEIELGKDGGKGFGEDGLAASRGTAHQDIVPPGRGDFQGALRVFLTADVFHVEEEGFFLEERFHVNVRMRGDISYLPEVLSGIEERGDRDHGDAPYHGGFSGVFLGDIELGEAEALGEERDREDAAYGTDFAVQREFADEEFVAEVKRELFGCKEKSQGHGHVVDGRVLGEIGRGKIDGDATEAVRRQKAAIFDRGRDAVAGFFDRGVGEADHGEVVHTRVEGVHFDFDEFALES